MTQGIVQATNTRLQELRQKVAKERSLHQGSRTKDRIHLEAQLSVAQRVADFLQTDAQVKALRSKCSAATSEYSSSDSSDASSVPESDDPLQVENLQVQLVKQQALLMQRDTASRAQLHKIRRLQRELAQAQQQTSSTKTQQEEERDQAQMKQLQTQIAEAEKEAHEWKTKVDHVRQESQTQAQQERQALQQDHETALAQQTEKLEALQAELSKVTSEGAVWKDKLYKAHTAITVLQQQDQTLQEQLQSQQAQLQAQEVEHARQQERLQQFHADAQALEENLNASYNETLTHMAHQVHELEQALEQAQCKVDEVESQPQANNNDSVELQDELKNKVASLQDELTTALQARQAAEHQAQMHAIKIDTLTKDMEEMEDYLNKSYSETLDLMVTQISELKTRLAAETENNEELEEQLHQKLAEKQTEWELSNIQCLEQEAQVAQLQQQLQQLEATQAQALVDSQTVLDALQAKHQVLVQEKEAAKARVVALQGELEHAQATMAWQEKSQADLLSAKEQELQVMTQKLENLQSGMDSSKHRSVHLQAELEQAQAQSTSLHQDLQLHTQLVADLKAQLAATSERNNVMEETQLEAAVQDLRVQIQEMRRHLTVQERQRRKVFLGLAGLALVTVFALQGTSVVSMARDLVTESMPPQMEVPVVMSVVEEQVMVKDLEPVQEEIKPVVVEERDVVIEEVNPVKGEAEPVTQEEVTITDEQEIIEEDTLAVPAMEPSREIPTPVEPLAAVSPHSLSLLTTMAREFHESIPMDEAEDAHWPGRLAQHVVRHSQTVARRTQSLSQTVQQSLSKQLDRTRDKLTPVVQAVVNRQKANDYLSKASSSASLYTGKLGDGMRSVV